MVSISVGVLVVSMAVFATAQIPSLGWCPDYQPMADFDMERFLGKWYEAARYFTFSEVATRCAVSDYAKSATGRIFISNEVTNRLTGVKRVIGGSLELAGRGNEGKMNVKYDTTPLSTESTLVVLDTDYDNYAVIWSCSGIGPIHAQNAWLMTRERLAPGSVLQEAYGVLDKFRISRTFFVKTDQEKCSLVASDLNAANGIASSSSVPQALGTEQKSVNSKSKPSGDSSAKLAVKSNAQSVPLRENEAKPEVPAEEIKLQPGTVAQHIINNVGQEGGENSQPVKDVPPEASR